MSHHFVFRALRRLLCAAVFLFAATACFAGTTFKVEGNFGYFMTDGQTAIQRYDFASETWLTAITLTATPTAVAASPARLYVAYGRRIEQMNLDGTGKAFITNTATDVVDLMLDGYVLIANRSNYLYAYFTSFDTRTNLQISDRSEYPFSAFGSSICTATNKIFGRSSGVSPSDIVAVSYNDAGELLSIHDSTYHGDYPDASRTWCFPNGNKVLDNSGTVYTTSDMRYVASLGNQVLSVGFVGTDTPITLVNGELVAYSNAIVETGRFTLTNASAHTLHVRGQKIYAFRAAAGPSGLGTEIVPLSSLTTSPPDVPISPIGLSYDFDQIVSDGANMLYILSGIHNSIFRWNVSTQRYVDTIPLPETGSRIAYSAALNRLYVSTPSQRIYRISLGIPSPQAVIHAQTPTQVNVLLPMHSDLLIAANGSWNSNWVLDSNGQVLASNTQCCYYDYVHFDPSRNLLYFDDDNRITYLGGGQFSYLNSVGYGWNWQPVGFSPDGMRAARREGSVVNLDSAQVLGYLSNRIAQAGWFLNGTLISINENSVGYPSLVSQQIQRWASNFELVDEMNAAGTDADLHMFGNRAVIVTQLNGAPNFTVFDALLNVVAPQSWEAPLLAVNHYSAIAADLSWAAIQGEQEVLLERSSLSNPLWQQVGIATRDRLTISNSLSAPDLYRFRIRARNGATMSPYSNVVEVDTRGTPLVAVDPRVTVFVPDDAFFASDGRLYLLSSINRSIFVWDMQRQDWLPTIALRGEARYMSYSQAHDAIFTSYTDGLLFGTARSGSPAAELSFAEGPLDNTCGLVATDDVLVTCDFYGAWESQSSFSMSGQLLDTHEWRYPINGGVWSPVTRRVYHLSDNPLLNDLMAFTVDIDGRIGQQLESPYHTSTGIGHPVRVSPAGDVVILGPGQVFDANTLEYAGNLPRPMSDATWLDTRLFTANGARIDAHQPGSYALTTPTRTLDRPVLRLFSHASGKFVVLLSRPDGGSEPRVLGGNLQDVEKPVLLDGFE